MDFDEVAFDQMHEQFGRMAEVRRERAQRVFKAFCNGPILVEDGRSFGRMDAEGYDNPWSRAVDDSIAQNLDHQTIGDFIKIILQHQTQALEAAVRAELQQIGRRGGLAKAAADPKQKDKAFVFDCWKMWQIKPDHYKGKAEFGRDMLEKCPSLLSQKVIEDWCRNWEKAKR
nr:hypothetical protein [uncultured Rhodoferax sp.]